MIADEPIDPPKYAYSEDGKQVTLTNWDKRRFSDDECRAAYRKYGIDPANPDPDGSDHLLMNAIDEVRSLRFSMSRDNKFIEVCRFSLLGDGRLDVMINPELEMTEAAAQFVNHIREKLILEHESNDQQ